jgi:hypothetical protein
MRAPCLKKPVAAHIEEVAADDLDLLFQPIEGEPRLRTIAVSAPALLN